MDEIRQSFSFQGYASRADWWTLALAPHIALTAMLLGAFLWIDSNPLVFWFFVIVAIILGFPAAWMMLATSTRRLRDRGRPIVLAAVLVLPAVFSTAVDHANVDASSATAIRIVTAIVYLPTLWLFFECAFLPSR